MVRAAAPEVAPAVAKLERLKVVDDTDYWLTNAQGRQTCDGARVGAVLIAAANRIEKVDTLDQALTVLVKRKVLTKADYWSEHAVEGKTCSGGQVAALLSRLAKSVK